MQLSYLVLHCHAFLIVLYMVLLMFGLGDINLLMFWCYFRVTFVENMWFIPCVFIIYELHIYVCVFFSEVTASTLFYNIQTSKNIKVNNMLISKLYFLGVCKVLVIRWCLFYTLLAGFIYQLPRI